MMKRELLKAHANHPNQIFLHLPFLMGYTIVQVLQGSSAMTVYWKHESSKRKERKTSSLIHEIRLHRNGLWASTFLLCFSICSNGCGFYTAVGRPGIFVS